VCVCACVSTQAYVCVGIPHTDRTPTAASLLCKQAHPMPPALFLLNWTCSQRESLMLSDVPMEKKVKNRNNNKRIKKCSSGSLIYYSSLIGL